MTWKASTEGERCGPGTLYYLRATGRGNAEGGHRVALDDGRALDVLPDGHSTARGRRDVLAAALRDLEPITTSDGLSLDSVAYLVGCLVLRLGDPRFALHGRAPEEDAA